MGRIFERAEKYIDQIQYTESRYYTGSWLEIGTSRAGDDGSTYVLADWAMKYGNRPLHTVDIDTRYCEMVSAWSAIGNKNVKVHNMSGEDFFSEILSNRLSQITSISFLYLDNFDWDWHPERQEDFILDQQVRYKQLGYEMNNVNSQRAHLAQAMLALPYLDYKCLVICDDTWYNKHWGHYTGKCGAVVPFLLNNGFKVLETEDHPTYGTILGRNVT